MLQHPSELDLIFQALADPTRRDIVERLTIGPTTVSELSRPFGMSLAGVLQHVRVLESSGLIHTRKAGRVRMCHIDPRALHTAEDWITERRTTWQQRLDRLADIIEDDAPGS